MARAPAHFATYVGCYNVHASKNRFSGAVAYLSSLSCWPCQLLRGRAHRVQQFYMLPRQLSHIGISNGIIHGMDTACCTRAGTSDRNICPKGLRGQRCKQLPSGAKRPRGAHHIHLTAFSGPHHTPVVWGGVRRRRAAHLHVISLGGRGPRAVPGVEGWRAQGGVRKACGDRIRRQAAVTLLGYKARVG